MNGFMAIVASITMLATTGLFGKSWAAPIGVSKVAAAQYVVDHQTVSLVPMSDTVSASVILTAGHGGGGMHGGGGGMHGGGGGTHASGGGMHGGGGGMHASGGGMHGGGGSFHGGGGSFHGGPMHGGLHNEFHHEHGDFHHEHNDFFFGFGFGYYPYVYPYYYPYYPYGYYPDSSGYSDSNYCPDGYYFDNGYCYPYPNADLGALGSSPDLQVPGY
jgi:hypothetical protein